LLDFKVSPISKVRGAFVGLGLFFPFTAWYLDHWSHFYFFFPVITILLGERLLYEVHFTLTKATHLLNKIQKNSDEVTTKPYSEDFKNLSNKFTEAITNYDPEKRVAALLKSNTGLEDVLNQEFNLKGRYNSGQYAIGEIWNKPEGILDEGPAQKSNLSYKMKLRLWNFSVDMATKELEMMEESLNSRSEQALAGIVKFQIIMLKDNVLQNKVKRGLGTPGSFSNGLKNVLDPIREKLRNPNPKFDRSSDLQDLEQRLLKAANRRSFNHVTDKLDLTGKIVLCQHILPTEILQFNEQGANGFVVLHGEKASHSCILFNSMNIESVTGINIEELDLPNGTRCIIDAVKGNTIFRPSGEKFQLYSELLNNKPKEYEIDNSPIFIDNEQFFIRANVSIVKEIDSIKQSKPDGIGLFRSEMQFMLNDIMPNVETQADIYREISDAFPKEMVVLRVLDSGGDKVSNYNENIKEENPSLGFKAIRYLLSEPQILANQIEAMALSLLDRQGTILIPMITTLEEVEIVFDIYRTTLEKFGDFEKIRKHVKLGLMIETPASILMLDKMQAYFDSFSIGTNDLTQYILAADRNNSRVSSIYSHLSPAVVRAILQTSEVCRAYKKPLSICGELAQNIEAIPLIVGLGIREISVNHSEIAELRNFTRQLNIEKCREIASHALQCSNEKDIYDLLNSYKENVCKQN
jgi:phosphotransferase system, enzyme I, PtsP